LSLLAIFALVLGIIWQHGKTLRLTGWLQKDSKMPTHSHSISIHFIGAQSHFSL